MWKTKYQPYLLKANGAGIKCSKNRERSKFDRINKRNRLFTINLLRRLTYQLLRFLIPSPSHLGQSPL